MSWQIQNCTVSDAAALAHNNMSAFWEDPSWRIVWPDDITLEFLIEQGTKRQPRNLLRSRDTYRHQKAVDPVTGAVVGYARWILPASHVTAKENDAGPEWVEAQVPAVSEEETARFGELADSAWWEMKSGMDHMDDKNRVVMDRILAERPYISKSSIPFKLFQLFTNCIIRAGLLGCSSFKPRQRDCHCFGSEWY